MKRLASALLLAAGTFLATGVFLISTSATAGAADLCNNTNAGAVQNQPTARNMACTFTTGVHITQIVTYHWNGGRGKPPGTLGLKSNATGHVYGPYAATGSSGSGGAPNVNWTANVNFCVPAGGYLILDSDFATWSMNLQSAYRGFVIVRGDTSPCMIGKFPIGQPPLTLPTRPPAGPPVMATPRPPPPATARPPAAPAAAPCYTNSGAIAAVGPKPCFGPPGTMIDVFILRATTYVPYTQVHFKNVPVNGVPAVVIAPLAGSSAAGSIMTVAAPAQLCLARSNSKWQVWLANATRELGEIGEFTIISCP
jgi:hypothetical protein